MSITSWLLCCLPRWKHQRVPPAVRCSSRSHGCSERTYLGEAHSDGLAMWG